MQYKMAGVFLFTLLIVFKSFSQDTSTPDGLFQAARKAAFDDKNYGRAIELSKKALLLSPNYADIRIFLGRVYTWSNQYDSARAAFQYVLNSSPDHEDAAAAYTDLEYWNNNNDVALKVVNNGLQHHPNSESLLIRKAKILFALRRYKESAAAVNTILQVNKGNTEARALAERIKEAVAMNSIGISYSYTSFDKQFADPWHLVSIDYGRQTKLGSFSLRLNYGNRFKQSGTQYEVDMYPRISKVVSTYVSVGYSGDESVFPKYRAGFSLYLNLPKSFEAEIGTRYLYFSDPTWIYTLYLGKYYKNFLFGARTYLTPSSNNISQSYNLVARYYYSGNADDYLNFTIGTGVSPDERPAALLLNSSYKLASNKVSLSAKKSFGSLNVFGLSAGWANQEYQPKTRGNQVDLGISYQRRF
jgi:YaiO family outer membrane protein